MITSKAVFFEELDSYFFSLAKRYLKEGFVIYFFRIDKKLKSNNIIKNGLEQKKIFDINSIVFDYTLYRKAAFYAHEKVDLLFKKYFANSNSIKNMETLLESKDISEMYKYRFLRELDDLFTVELKINQLIGKFDIREAHFFSYNYQFHSDSESLLQPEINVIEPRGIRVYFKLLFERIKTIFSLGAPIYVLLKKFGGLTINKNRKNFKIGIMVFPFHRSIFGMNYLTETFFVNSGAFEKSEVLFIDNSYKINFNDYAINNYNYTSLIYKRKVFSTSLFFNKIIKKFFPAFFKSLFNSVSETSLITKTNASILFDFVAFNILLDNYTFENYIKKLLPDNLSRIHILSQNNVKTWFVFADNTSNDYFLDWGPLTKNQTGYSFMYFDNAIIYGDSVERFFIKHRNQINHYHKIGISYSQIIKEIENGDIKSKIFSLMRSKNMSKTTIAVFDTTFVDSGPLKVADGVQFGKDILRLLEEMPDISIIFKAAKSDEERPSEITEVYNALKVHPRCLFIPMWDKDGISAVEVIAAANLTVSAAYTSTTAEALCARKKAVYYDVTGHNLGDKYYFNRYPNLVAHSYEELKKIIHYWLYNVKDKDFDLFLNKYVKNEIDPYLDCKGLDRFRNLFYTDSKKASDTR